MSNHFPEHPIELTIVNDGSGTELKEDEIRTLKESCSHLRYITYSPNHGKGYALREGVKKSNAEFILFTDIDFPYNTTSMVRLLNTLLAGRSDAVIGVRSEEYYQELPFARRFISKALKGMNKRLLGLKVNDTQCGLKGFNKKGKHVFLSTTIDRFLFDLEFIYLLSRGDYQVSTVDVELREGVEFRSMRLSILLVEGWNFLRILLRKRD